MVGEARGERECFTLTMGPRSAPHTRRPYKFTLCNECMLLLCPLPVLRTAVALGNNDKRAANCGRLSPVAFVTIFHSVQRHC